MERMRDIFLSFGVSRGNSFFFQLVSFCPSLHGVRQGKRARVREFYPFAY